jgi:rod shape-determining protein MreC
LGTVVALTLIILNLPGKTTARLKLGIGGLFLPLFGLANSSQQLAGKAGDALTPRGDLLRQIEALRQENEALKLKSVEAEKTFRENDRLRHLLGWQQALEQRKRWKLKPASVVLHDPANFWRSVHVDLGSRDGVRPDKAVLAPDGSLVGRVSAVSSASSQIVLLGDPNCRVAVRVEGQPTDFAGIIRPSGPLDSEFVEMLVLSRGAAPKPGQDVKTSGNGGIFPEGLLVGKIVDTRSVDYGLETVARVKLAANLSALDEVWVMLEP